MQFKSTLYDIIGYIFSGVLLALFITLGWVNFSKDMSLLCAYWNRIASLKFPEVLCILGISYLIGHVISSLSSLVIEKWSCKGVENSKIIFSDLLQRFEEKFEDKYQLKPSLKNFRLCICHVESKRPRVYSTAFVFQCFYGMARNTTFLLFMFGIWELYLLLSNLISKSFHDALFAFLWCLGSFLLALFMFYIYLRFIKYFRLHIICGFLIDD